MDIGALLGMLVAAVVIGAVTGGAGALALGVLGAATLSIGSAVVGAVIASSVGVAMQLGITAAIDHKNGGAAATADMQSGFSDSTTKQYQALVGNSLLFGGNFDINNNDYTIDDATQISSANMNQTAQTNESVFFEQKHETIGPDWNQLMTDAAINGVVSGITVAAGPLISAGVGKLANIATTTLNNNGLSSVVNGLKTASNLIDDVVTKIDDFTGSLSKTTGFNKITNVIDDISNSAISKINNSFDNIGLTKYGGKMQQQLFIDESGFMTRNNYFNKLSQQQGITTQNSRVIHLGTQTNDDILVAGRFGKRPLDNPIGDYLYEKFPDKAYHTQYVLDDGTNIGRGSDGLIKNETKQYVINSQYYDDAKMVPIILKNDAQMGKYNLLNSNCQDLQRLSEIESLYGGRSLDPILLINNFK